MTQLEKLHKEYFSKGYSRIWGDRPDWMRVAGDFLEERTGVRKPCLSTVQKMKKVISEVEGMPRLPGELQRLKNYQKSVVPSFPEPTLFDEPVIQVFEIETHRGMVLQVEASEIVKLSKGDYILRVDLIDVPMKK